MKQMYKIKLALLILLFFQLVSCDKFEAHPYDVKIDGEVGINEKNIKKIQFNCLNKDTLRIAVIGDTQGWLDETKDEVADINSRGNIDFVIHDGDVSDFGLTKEFMWQRDILNKLHAPYVVVIGNHDCLGNGEDAFRIIFGELNFSFITNRIKFLFLNTNALEYDYSEAVPDFSFMKTEAETDTALFDRTVINMHAAPYCEQFNNNVAEAFEDFYVSKFPHVMFCTKAHDHRYEVLDIYGDGLLYFGTDSAKGRSYIVFTITPKGYTYEHVEY
jgi:hypothetical protein